MFGAAGIGGVKCDECGLGYVQERPLGPGHEVGVRLQPLPVHDCVVPGAHPGHSPQRAAQLPALRRVLRQLGPHTGETQGEHNKVRLFTVAYSVSYRSVQAGGGGGEGEDHRRGGRLHPRL